MAEEVGYILIYMLIAMSSVAAKGHYVLHTSKGLKKLQRSSSICNPFSINEEKRLYICSPCINGYPCHCLSMTGTSNDMRPS
ncbi:hypothetical protein SESBI_23212 [Sesbania bispinosa]|nr:hypothetical protein SESBI_23212 [Sesbania bispinosa]